VKFRIAAIAAMLTLGLNAHVFADSIRDSASAAATTPADENLRPPVPLARPLSLDAGFKRPIGLPALYASLVALQGFDIYSTNRAIANGAHEANPMMQGVVGNPALFYGVKAVATVAPMLAAERMWKTNKARAVAVMLISNGVMAAVAAHNASVLAHQR
jgi:hypothetical protein